MIVRRSRYDGWVYRSYGLGCHPETGIAIPDAEQEWVVDLAKSDPALASAMEDESICVEETAGSRYFTSMYWALMTISTVGYGDYTAQTNAEKL